MEWLLRCPPKPHIQTHLHTHEPGRRSPLLYLWARGPGDTICIMHMNRKRRIVAGFFFWGEGWMVVGRDGWVLLLLLTICWCVCVGAFFPAWQIKSPPHPGLLHPHQASDGWLRCTWIRTVPRKKGAPNRATTHISSVKSVIMGMGMEVGGGVGCTDGEPLSGICPFCLQHLLLSVYSPLNRL